MTTSTLPDYTQAQLENIYSLDFARFIKATIVNGGGLLTGFDAFCERYPRALTLQVKAAVKPRTIAEPAWAAPLAQLQPAINAVVRRAHARSILGRLQGYRSVPFNVAGAFQTSGATYAWIGEGAPKTWAISSTRRHP